MAKARAAPKAEAKPTAASTTSGVKKTRSRTPAKNSSTPKEAPIKKAPATKKAPVSKKATALKELESGTVVNSPIAHPPTAAEFGQALDTITHATLIRVLKKLHGHCDFQDGLVKELLVSKSSVKEWEKGENHVRSDLAPFGVRDEDNSYDDENSENIYTEYAQSNEPIAKEQNEVETSKEKAAERSPLPEPHGFRPRYAICFNCKKEFDASDNQPESCKYHPGSLDADELAEELGGDLTVDEYRELGIVPRPNAPFERTILPKVWTCCGLTNEDFGDHCIVGRHRDLALVPDEVVMRRINRENGVPGGFLVASPL